MTYSSRTLIFIFSVLTIILSSCVRNNSSPLINHSTQEKTSIVPSEITSSWTDFSSWVQVDKTIQYEIINGIQVPPEPDPIANNATLTGIDVNENGVRDDVERVIAISVSTIQQFNNAIPLVKAYQAVLIKTTPTTRDDGLTLEKGLLCSTTDYSSIPASLRPVSDTSLEAMIFNTDERKTKLQLLRAIVGGFDSGEVSCD